MGVSDTSCRIDIWTMKIKHFIRTIITRRKRRGKLNGWIIPCSHWYLHIPLLAICCGYRYFIFSLVFISTVVTLFVAFVQCLVVPQLLPPKVKGLIVIPRNCHLHQKYSLIQPEIIMKTYHFLSLHNLSHHLMVWKQDHWYNREKQSLVYFQYLFKAFLVFFFFWFFPFSFSLLCFFLLLDLTLLPPLIFFSTNSGMQSPSSYAFNFVPFHSLYQ